MPNITIENVKENWFSFVEILIKKNRNFFLKVDFLEFWALSFRDPGRKKFESSLLIVTIGLLEPMSNVFAEGLGRIGSMIRNKIRMKMEESLLDCCMVVYKDGLDGGVLQNWESHLENLYFLWKKTGGKNAIPVWKK